MKLWKNWDENEKASFVRITGLVIGGFAIFALIAQISYLIHWTEDMSLLSDPDMMDRSRDAANKASKLGARFGNLTVCELFGLASFILTAAFGAISYKLVAHKWMESIVKTILGAFTLTVIASILFSFIGDLCGIRTIFGGGPGGKLGAYIVDWSVNLIGYASVGICILILLVCWLFLCSRRFTEWFAALGSKQTSEEKSDSYEKAKALAEEQTTEQAEPAIQPEQLIDQETQLQDVNFAIAQTVTAAEKVEVIAPEQGLDIITGDELSTVVKEPLKPIDNRMDPPEGLPRYKFPSLDLLEDYSSSRHIVSGEELQRNNNKIRAALANYKIQITDVKALVGASVTLYKVYPAPGVQIAQIRRLQDDIGLSLGTANGVRVVTLNDSVGIEVANDRPSTVPLKALLNDAAFRDSKAELPVAIGYTITQKVKVFDLSDAPHLLIAGATKQGKSVGLNVIVSSLLYSKHPSELKFVFIDPKMVEFSSYANLLKHYLAVLPDAGNDQEEKDNAIVKNPKKAEQILKSLCLEMDERYALLSKAGVNKITVYNEKYKARHLLPTEGHRYLPYLVCVVDEYADLTMTTGASPETRAASKSITNSIIRLAQKGRAAGLHVILATQRPSVDVISGVIKSNFPMRIAFRVSSRVDSQTILDVPGAEKLIGRGDMLFSAGIDSERIQCGFVDIPEIDAVTKFIGEQQGYAKSYNTPYYLPEVVENDSEGGSGGLTDMSEMDDRFRDAAELVVTTQKASTSYLQTRLGMGFAKAARVMGQLEAAGIVGPQEGAKQRQVLIPDLNSLQPILDAFCK